MDIKQTGEHHRKIVQRLIEIGLSNADARLALGVVIDEILEADRAGYIRGYNNGAKDAKDAKVGRGDSDVL